MGKGTKRGRTHLITTEGISAFSLAVLPADCDNDTTRAIGIATRQAGYKDRFRSAFFFLVFLPWGASCRILVRKNIRRPNDWPN